MPVVRLRDVLAVTSDSGNGLIIQDHLSRTRRVECTSAIALTVNLSTAMSVTFLRSARCANTFAGRMNRKAVRPGGGTAHYAASVIGGGILT